ncbi:MAG: ATP-dependent sacrificial sulfur transferase LarE [Candidatus Baldrarchaeia archaeon]
MSKRRPEEVIELISRKMKEKGKLAVAFSGGVDSSVLAALAHRSLGDNAIAVTIKSPLLPSGELEDAIRVAREIGIRHRIVELNELNLPDFSKNPPNRCYICKKHRYGLIKRIASEMGISVIADGTNVSDLAGYRPGLKAIIEENIWAPFLEFEVSKDQIREMARILGLSVAEKPSTTCLATRFPYGEVITLEKLRIVDKAERIIKRRLNVGVVRVRYHGAIARIEVEKSARRKFFDERIMDEIAEQLRKLGFRYVCLDLMGYRSGSLDEVPPRKNSNAAREVPIS